MNRLRSLIRNKRVRQAIAAIVVILTFALFGYYSATHPEVLRSLAKLEPATLLLLSLAYVVTVVANAFVLYASLRLIGTRVGFAENVSLTGYSSVVNFFGPLQSGPGFRAAYLKQRHGVSLKKFFYVTLVFYGFFGLLNGLIIAYAAIARTSLLGATGLIVAVIGGAILLALAIRMRPGFRKLFSAVKVTEPNFWYIGVGAALLSIATVAAYYVELTHVDSSITIAQSVIYAAAANLALFVSLTPGAIGFRESFLLLSQQLHDIPSNVVIAASIIDRAFYVIFLLVLFAALLLFGVRRRLRKP